MALAEVTTLTQAVLTDPVIGPPKVNSALIENNPRLNRRVRLLTDDIARKPSDPREVIIAQGFWQYEDHL